MKRQFVKAASAAKMLDSFEAKLAELKGSDIESATAIPKPTSTVTLTPEQEDALWEIDGRYDNVDVADEDIPAVISEIHRTIMKELGLDSRSAKRVMIDILGYEPDDIIIDAATDVKCSVELTPEQKDLVWEIANRYATSWPLSGKWSDETAHEQHAIAEELGVSLAEAKQIMIDELGFDPNLYSEDDHWAEDLSSATKVTCNEYIDVDGMFGEPGAIITDDEMREYWDNEHDDDPVLSEYPDFESWWADTKQWLKLTDNSYADMYVESSTEEVDDELDIVEGQEWGDDQVFMIMDYTAGDEGPESDTFDCYGKFFAKDEADAKRQLEEVKAADPDRMQFMDNAYIEKYNEYFDDGDEVYPNLVTLVKSSWIAPNDYDGNMYDDDLPFASTQVDGDNVTTSELIMDGEEVAEPLEEGVECSDDMFTDIEQDIAKDAEEEPVEASMGRYDDYFGQTAAKKYGELIASNLSGQTVSKRQDLAEEPGGLIYTANLLGIDMWDLLEALEGMCYEGKAAEIDDSTYRIN